MELWGEQLFWNSFNYLHCKKGIVIWTSHLLSEWQVSIYYMHGRFIRSKNEKLFTTILPPSKLSIYLLICVTNDKHVTSQECQNNSSESEMPEYLLVMQMSKWQLQRKRWLLECGLGSWPMNYLFMHVIWSLTWNSDNKWLVEMTIPSWASLITGIEYGRERWNGKWNGTVNIQLELYNSCNWRCSV